MLLFVYMSEYLPVCVCSSTLWDEFSAREESQPNSWKETLVVKLWCEEKVQ